MVVIEKLSTGIEGLDRLTDGGFRRGSAYIVQGPPGAGKTILANQFCYAHVRDGGRALYMSLLAESSDRMLAYVRQMAFFDEDVVPGRLQYVSGYGVLEREGLPGLSKLIQHELKRHQATAMVLDGTFVAQAVASEQEFRAFIHGLQGVATAAGAVLVMLTHQARAATSPEHTMVDGWIEMSNETVGYRAVQHIQVRKQRGAAIVGGKHSFRISAKGITVFQRKRHHGLSARRELRACDSFHRALHWQPELRLAGPGYPDRWRVAERVRHPGDGADRCRQDHAGPAFPLRGDAGSAGAHVRFL
jgi:circadian clock protein KaiC